MSSAESPGRLIVGTSGFSYKHWRGVFYPEDVPQSRWLEHYAEHFSAVELNVSFYRLPKRETFAEWAERTPERFEFVVKGSRLITHYHRLHDVEQAVSAFFSAAFGLSNKLACVLWQFPPKSAPDPRVLDDFCALLEEQGRRTGGGRRVRHAFEFRDERWFSEDIYDVLRAHGCALVIADPPREGEPRMLTTDFTYLRFHHGPRESGAYETRDLRPYAKRARAWMEDGSDVFAFFNNDPGGWAPRNAEAFDSLVAAANHTKGPRTLEGAR